MPTGELKINKVKKGLEYHLIFENAKGKTVDMVIQQGNCHFDKSKVENGDPIQFELVNGQPVKCVVPGKEAIPVIKESKPMPPAKDNFRNYNSAPPRNTQGMALTDAVAPYNFVPFEAKNVLTGHEEEARVWSGQLICKLTALTPLLVCGQQDRASASAPATCAFMRLNGQSVIPGTSIKGMLRSLMEIMSFSNMLPVSKKRLFWRRVNRPDYRSFFSQDGVSGGFLRKQGATYLLYPVKVYPQKPNEPRIEGCLKVKTGGFPLKTGGMSKVYYFAMPSSRIQPIELPVELISTFMDQLTPKQEERYPKAGLDKLMTAADSPGMPIFYRTDEQGKIVELGSCRYFRLKYRYSPHDLAYPDGQKAGQDFVTSLFGTVGEDNFAGHVSVEPCRLQGRLYREKGVDVVLGGPKPTCLPLYIVQNPRAVRTISSGKKNDPDSMASYNDSKSKLRGHKLYWHHDVDEALFPGREAMAKKDGSPNYKVISRLFPMAPGASAQVVIHVDHLTDTELGALLEAIQLPQGHAHKLGMGKSLGFGSVRLEIAEARIFDSRESHSSLSRRLIQPQPRLTGDKIDGLKARFREKILKMSRAVVPAWANIQDYDKLPPIHALRLMMDYAHRPTPVQVRTMSLNYVPGDPLTRINFSRNAILPTPEEVLKKR